MVKKNSAKLTPYLKEKYEQILKLKQENPQLSIRAIVTQLGTSHDSYLKAKRLIENGEAITESKHSVSSIARTKKQPKLVTVPIAAEVSTKPLIALIGTPEDVIRSLNSMFN